MNLAMTLVGVIVGFVLGLIAAYFLGIFQSKTVDTVIEQVKQSFGKLSLDALSQSTSEFLKLAKEKLDSERELSKHDLDSKKGLIDQQLVTMSNELEKVTKLIKDFEDDRKTKYGELTNQLKNTNEQTNALLQITNTLRETLANTRVRGQWGERMAEDVLRLAGFIENINYLKQKTISSSGLRPDFTFLLPRNLKLNMDVKFPLDNYIRYLDVKIESEKIKYCADFLKDVKSRIKEVTTREYINPEQNTVDYVLLFIPNEQIYAFIHEQDSTIFDEGIKNKVIFCSPVTLFAVLAIIRQAVDNFSLEQTSNEILSLFGQFKKQWSEFLKKLESLGKRIEDAHSEYETLTTTRRRQLEKPLNKIESIRTQRGLPLPSTEDMDLSESLGEIKEEN